MPRRNHGKNPTTNKAFPGLVGTKGNKFAMNELASARHTRNIRHNIVSNHQENWQGKPK